MSKTITKTLYTFEELLALNKAGEVKSSVVEKVRMALILSVGESEWYDSDYEDWMTALAEIGFTDAKILHSGFSVQGDGASFESTVDLKVLLKFLSCRVAPSEQILDGEENGWVGYVVHKLGAHYSPDERFAKLIDVVDTGDFRATVERDSTCRYLHESSCDFLVDYNGPEEFDDLLNEFETVAEELREALCRIIYRVLEAQWDAITTNEELIEEDKRLDNHWDITGHLEK